MQCKYCNSKMEKMNLNMTGYVGPYKFIFVCPNQCDEGRQLDDFRKKAKKVEKRSATI